MDSVRSGSTIPDPRDRNLSARDRMIAAGLEALLHKGGDVLADGLHRKRLASIAGQSRQTLYTHFATHTEYLEAMIDVVLDPEHPMWPVNDITGYVDDVFGGTDDGTISVIDELAHRDFSGLLRNEHWRLVLAVRALVGERDDVRAGLARNWVFYHRRTTQALGHLLDQWNVELIPPWTTEKAAHVFAALSEGLALRVDALDGEGADLLAITTTTLAAAIVAPRGERAEPLEPTIPVDPQRREGPLTPAHVERALAHAVTSYVESDVRPSFESMARASGCSSSMLRTRFERMDDVVSAVWDRLAVDLARQALEVSGDASVSCQLRQRLEALAATALHSPVLTADLLRLCLENGGSDSAMESLIDPFERLLCEASERQELAFGPTPRVLADHLVRTMLSVSLTGASTREASARSAADLVWILVIDGCRRTPG